MIEPSTRRPCAHASFDVNPPPLATLSTLPSFPICTKYRSSTAAFLYISVKLSACDSTSSTYLFQTLRFTPLCHRVSALPSSVWLPVLVSPLLHSLSRRPHSHHRRPIFIWRCDRQSFFNCHVPCPTWASSTLQFIHLCSSVYSWSSQKFTLHADSES